tara:strand:+ start:1993 stop:2634 length:642 start_codon:yes stop_codon:yes gene_type:complete
MHNSVQSLISIQKEISNNNSNANIIAVSKTFPIDKITPLIKHGHVHFGENKVQEAVQKWSEVKKTNNNIKLHLIGKLQTNKVKFVLPLFDYIHSLDSIKLAEKISIEQKKKEFKPKIFIQVNIGNENQKNGVSINELESFYKECKKNYNLDIIGLMCIPPIGNSTKFFSKMLELNNLLNLSDLSMGMSSDYLEALNFKATFVRIGSLIFGERI